MTSNPFQVLGSSVPRMLGRATLLRRIDRHLSKASPDHVSVVGPAHYGKSVLLRHVANAYQEGSGYYLTTVHVDLRHAGITSDRDFRRCFADDIRAALQPYRPGVAENLDPVDDSIHELLDLVFDELAAESARVLVVFDGFDHVLARADLTRTLWDQLRTLAQKPSLQLVAGSRLPLREICRTEESRTSDFWEIFNSTPVRVGALDGDDLGAFMQPLVDAGCTIDESARKEMEGSTGGVPLLVCALLRRLWDSPAKTSRLSRQDVNQAAEAVFREEPDLFGALWDDCDMELRADLATLGDAGMPRADLSERRLRAIEDRGFGSVTGKRVRSACRLMQRYASAQAPAIADLKEARPRELLRRQRQAASRRRRAVQHFATRDGHRPSTTQEPIRHQDELSADRPPAVRRRLRPAPRRLSGNTRHCRFRRVHRLGRDCVDRESDGGPATRTGDRPQRDLIETRPTSASGSAGAGLCRRLAQRYCDGV